jgi:trimethylamine:corrinoid methyltransferase-like protein
MEVRLKNPKTARIIRLLEYQGGLGLNLFTNDELEEIHMATLEVLEKTGLLFDDDEALEVLDGGGATIDKNTRIAKLPPYLVEDAIRSAPSKLLLAGRNPKHDFVMESNRVGFTNFGEGVFRKATASVSPTLERVFSSMTPIPESTARPPKPMWHRLP